MADIEFDDMARLAAQLNEDEQNRLIVQLRVQQAARHAKKEAGSHKPSVENSSQPFQGALGLFTPSHIPNRQELLDELADRKNTGRRKKPTVCMGNSRSQMFLISALMN